MPRVGKLFHSAILCHLFGFVLSTSCIVFVHFWNEPYEFILNEHSFYILQCVFSWRSRSSLKHHWDETEWQTYKKNHTSKCTGYLPFLLWPFFPKVVVNIVHCSYFISCCMLYKWFVVNFFVGDMDSDVLKLQKGTCHYLYNIHPPRYYSK